MPRKLPVEGHATGRLSPAHRGPKISWSDRRLVGACLRGNDQAWSVLVDKYKNLVYSLVRKYRPKTDEAADIFQAVWLDAYNDLPKLRRKSAFKAWLVTITTRRCYHWKVQQKRRLEHEVEGEEVDQRLEADQQPSFVDELLQQQLVRDAVLKLSDRCREMIRLLFFTFPAKPYEEVAQKLELATGSIGFIRRRCLKKLQSLLEKQGL